MRKGFLVHFVTRFSARRGSNSTYPSTKRLKYYFCTHYEELECTRAMDMEIAKAEAVPSETALFQGWRLPDGLEFVPICISCFRTLRNGEDSEHKKATTRYFDILKDGGFLSKELPAVNQDDASVPLMCHKCVVKFQKDPMAGLVSLLSRSIKRIVRFCTSFFPPLVLSISSCPVSMIPS